MPVPAAIKSMSRSPSRSTATVSRLFNVSMLIASYHHMLKISLMAYADNIVSFRDHYQLQQHQLCRHCRCQHILYFVYLTLLADDHFCSQDKLLIANTAINLDIMSSTNNKVFFTIAIHINEAYILRLYLIPKSWHLRYGTAWLHLY